MIHNCPRCSCHYRHKTAYTWLPGNLHLKLFVVILAGRFVILQTPYQLTKFFYCDGVVFMTLIITCIRYGLISPPFRIINQLTISICNMLITLYHWLFLYRTLDVACAAYASLNLSLLHSIMLHTHINRKWKLWVLMLTALPSGSHSTVCHVSLYLIFMSE